MAPKKQVLVTPMDQEEYESPVEELEVQVKQAMGRQKNVPGHVENGKKMQAKGVEARKQNGYASQREKKLAAEQKKNDRLQRQLDIEAKETAERARGERLAGEMRDKEKAPPAKQETTDGQTDMEKRFQRLEELLLARQAEEPKKKAKSRANPKPKAAPKEESSDDEPVHPRQKQVRKSAQTEMRKKSGAMEEDIHSRGHLPSNPGMQKVMVMDQQDRYNAMARNLFPGMR